MIDWHGKAGNQWNDNDCLPLCLLSMSSNDATDECLSNKILNDCSPCLCAGDKELVFDVDKVLTHLNGLEIGILDAVFDGTRCAQTPRSCRSTDLRFASPRQVKLLELMRLKVGRRHEERHQSLVVLDAQEVIPSLGKVSAKISSWLSNQLQSNVMPGHSRV